MKKFKLLAAIFLSVFFAACALNKNNAGGGTNTDTGTTSSSGAVPPTESVALLSAHNQWRAKVGVPELQWSDKLAGMARQWAEQLAASNCDHRHSGKAGYGENIYFASPVTWSNGSTEVQKISPQHVVDDWGTESRSYDYASNSCSGVCGHYTQLVWKDSKEVGCGMAICGDKGQIWVCNYFPAGNVNNQRPY